MRLAGLEFGWEIGGKYRWEIPELETYFDEVIFEVEGCVCCVAEETEEVGEVLVADAVVCPRACYL